MLKNAHIHGIWLIIMLMSVTSYAKTEFIIPPYIQLGTATSCQVRYNTNTKHIGVVKIGTIPDNFVISYTETVASTEHRVNLTGLLPNTRYFYAVYVGDTLLKCGIDYFYKTSFPIGSTEKLNVWVTGDCGTGTVNQLNVASQMEKYLAGSYINAWLLLGDNAYSDGLYQEYQNLFFKPYQASKFIKQTSIYPSPGNHDYGYDPNAHDHKNISYFKFFSMPTQAEIGGLASGVPQYYSYDIHNVHFVSLDSYGRDNYVKFWDTLASPQIKWLKEDLAANKQPWTVVYFHHPPFTMGSHNSDKEQDLVAIRKGLVPIFEKYNVDLVLCGHSHTYERSKPFRGHYGLEPTFLPEVFNKSTSSGKYDGSVDSCPYIKLKGSSNNGVIYAVAGSSGWSPAAQPNYPHKAMPFGNKTEAGSMLLSFEGDRLDATFLTEKGKIDDRFTVYKTSLLPKDTTLLLPDTLKYITLKASPKPSFFWPGTKAITQNITIIPENGLVVRVADNMGCFPDVFRISKNSADCPKAKTQGFDYENFSRVKLNVSNFIKSENILSENTITEFNSGKAIYLNPGFEVKKGAIFSTSLKGCQ